MDLKRGMRDKLEKHIDINSPFDIKISTDGNSSFRYFCFGVDSSDVISDENYTIFYNRTSSPDNAINHSVSGNIAEFSLNLADIPKSINKLVFAVVIDGNITMGEINSHIFNIYQNGSESLSFKLGGSDFAIEKSIITAEIYRKDTWRINAIAKGFNNGLKDVLMMYGKESIELNPPKAEPEIQQKVDLKKGQKVNINKNSNGLGKISVNLKWNRGYNPIDLDIGCFYELKDGSKGAIQALGGKFGSFDKKPYILLDGDDRTGESSEGENIYINGSKISEIKRILIYTFIYKGITNWQQADGIVTVSCPGSPEIIVRMDEYNNNFGLCAIALLENVNDTFSVEKVVQFFRNQEYADRAFNWGMRWKPGKKD